MNRLVEGIAMGCLAVMATSVLYIVFMRYILNTGYPWGEEVALLSWVWLGFFSSALAIRDDTHMKLTFADKYLPARVIEISNVFNMIIMIAISALGIYMGIDMCILARFSELPGTGLSSIAAYLPVPIGFAISIVFLIRRGYKWRR